MKKAIITIAALALAFIPTQAVATGSDSPPLYDVATDGIQLPDGYTFTDNGHINVRFILLDGTTKQSGIHFEDRNWPADHAKRKYIGRSFIPWSAFEQANPSISLDSIGCISWVQIGHPDPAIGNPHFGEGGQAPVCFKPPVGPPSDSEERVRDTTVNCEERIVNWVKESRDAIFDYDWTEPGWVQTGWTDWVEIDSGFRNEKADQCDDIPVVGSELNVWLLGGGVLLLIAGVGIARIGRV